MNLLILDTTKTEGYVIGYINDINHTFTISGNEKHSESLLPQIEKLLISANVSINDIDAFGCVTGPGSFTGIRIGLSTVKAFNAVTGKPIYEGNVFEILADYIVNGILLLNCTKTTYYYGIIKNKQLKSYGVVDKVNYKSLITDDETIFFLKSEQQGEEFSYNKYETIKNYPYLIYQYFRNKSEDKNAVKDASIEPFYIQVSQAERDIKNKG